MMMLLSIPPRKPGLPANLFLSGEVLAVNKPWTACFIC